MKLTFLGNQYDVTMTEIPTVETGRVGLYRGQSIRFRSTPVAPSRRQVFTYRGNHYTA